MQMAKMNGASRANGTQVKYCEVKKKTGRMSKTNLTREFMNNPKCRALINEEMTKIFDILPISKAPNAVYKLDSYVDLFLNAGVRSCSVGGYADALRVTGIPHHPTGEHINQTMAKMTPELIDEFDKYLELLVARLKDKGVLQDSCDAAIDFHKIARYDKRREGRCLLHSKSDRGTTWFETYLTVQIVVKGARLVVAVLPYATGDSKAKAVEKVLEKAQKLVKIDTLLMDREFFTTEIMSTVDKSAVAFLTPCVNRLNVVKELRKFASGLGFSHIIQNKSTSGNGQEFEYTMNIQKRKKPKGDATLPEQKYIGFATNADVDPEEYYKRWGIETGYRQIEKCRVKTSSGNNIARLFCFVISCLLFNVWVMLNALLNGPDWDGIPNITQTVVAILIGNRGKPPPPS